MHSPLTAVVLCILAHAAHAQCVAPTAALDVRTGAELSTQVTTQVTTPSTPKPAFKMPAAVAGGELIKTAAAGTRDAPPVMREAPAPSEASAEEHPHRGGTAMLLAALALMSGIALRRYGEPRQ